MVTVILQTEEILPTVGLHPCGSEVHIDWTTVPYAANPKIGNNHYWQSSNNKAQNLKKFPVYIGITIGLSGNNKAQNLK